MFPKSDRSAPNYLSQLAKRRNAFFVNEVHLGHARSMCSILYNTTRLVLSTKGLQPLATVKVELEKYRQPYIK